MLYTSTCESPLGRILLASDGAGLTGLWFDGQKYFAGGLKEDHEEKELPVFDSARRWLDIYFAGREPDFMPRIHLAGTAFQCGVWEIMRRIPYGRTTTYGTIARIFAAQKGVSKMSAHAVGGAVAHNRISILIPCHRVISSDGNLTGYAGGIDKKIKLLTLEGVNLTDSGKCAQPPYEFH